MSRATCPARRAGRACLLVVVLTLLTALTSCSALGRDEPTSPEASSPGGSVADVRGGSTTDLRVSEQWTVSLPPDAAPAGAQMRSDPVDVAAVERLWGDTGARILQTSDISLSSGQPSAPVTLSYHLDRPLPAGEVLFLVSDTVDGAQALDGEPAPSTVLVAQMNADRTVGTVTTDHLSLKTWLTTLVDAVTNTVGQLLSQRSDPPDCSGRQPAWLGDAVFLDDVNGPMLVCVDVDPANADIAVVKVVNNRGGGILVTSPVTPAWAWQSIWGPKVEDIPRTVVNGALGKLGVSASERSRTWILPPGARVDIGIPQAAVRDARSFVIRGRMTPLTAAWGAATSVAGVRQGVVARDKPANIGLTLFQMGVLSVCADSVGNDASQGGTGLARAVIGLTSCFVKNPEAVVGLLTDQLEARAWATVKDDVLALAKRAKFVAGPLLAVGTAAFVTTDLVTTLQADEGAWTVALFARSARPPLTRAQVLNSAMPAGSCGDDAYGWPQPVPIRLRDGAGSALHTNGSFAGSSISDATVLGFADIDGDGRSDVVLQYYCFGSLPEQCCAGRTSRITFISALAVGDDRSLRRIGPVLHAGESGPGDEYGPAGRHITSASLSGTTVVTVEHVDYPEQYTTAQLGGQDPTAAVTARYRLRDGRWVAA